MTEPDNLYTSSIKVTPQCRAALGEYRKGLERRMCLESGTGVRISYSHALEVLLNSAEGKRERANAPKPRL